MPLAGPRPIARTAPTHRRPPKLPVGFVCSSSARSPLTMANGSLSALGPGGAFDLRDEGRTQARALAFVDRIRLERLHFELVNSQGPILPHPIRTPSRQGAWRPVQAVGPRRPRGLDAPRRGVSRGGRQDHAAAPAGRTLLRRRAARAPGEPSSRRFSRSAPSSGKCSSPMRWWRLTLPPLHAANAAHAGHRGVARSQTLAGVP